MAISILTTSYIALSGNPVYIGVRYGVIPAGATGYKYLLKVESVDGKLTGAPFTDAIAPNTAMEATFDIQGYVDQPVDNIFEWPVVNAVVLRTAPVFQINVRAGERYIDSNGDLHEHWNATAEEMYIFNGGVSQRQLAIWGDAMGFASVYLDGGKFLTQRPQSDIVHPSQPVKLWFFSVTENIANNLKITFYYEDGTDNIIMLPVSMPDDYALYELNVNPYHHGVDMVNDDGAKMSYFDVALYKVVQNVPDALVSDTRRFVYDNRPCERPFWLLFKNSLGGIDDIFLSGYATEGFATEGTTVYKPARQTDTVFDRTLVTPNKTGRNVWKINTGWKTATQMLHLRDLLLSREAWLLYPNNGVTNYYIIPVNITTTSAELINRQEDSYSLEIEMEEAHNSQFSFDNRLM